MTEKPKVWNTHSDKNGNNTSISRVSTATVKQKLNNNDIENPYLIGIQSKFRRKYFHKTVFIILSVLVILLLIGFIVLACFAKFYDAPCESKECLRAASNLLQSMDLSVDPCEDFYQFSCGNWEEDHPRPDSSNSLDWFSEKQNKVLRTVRTFLQSNGTASEPSAVNQSRYMYQACMNTTQMDTLGLRPLLDYIKLVNLPETPSILKNETASNRSDDFNWIRTIALIKRIFGADIIFGFDIFPDPSNKSINRLVLGTPESGSVLPFKTDFDIKIQSITRKRLVQSTAFEDFSYEDNDVIDEKELDLDTETVHEYTNYVIEVMSAIVFYADPTLNLDQILPKIKTAAQTTVKITKYLFKLSEDAENSTNTNAEKAVDDLLYLDLRAFQNASDHLIAPKTIPIWREYLMVLFNSSSNITLDLDKEEILTSKPDMQYVENVVEYLLDLNEDDLEVYIWWTIAEEMILHTTSDIRKLHNEYAKKITNIEGAQSRSIYCTGGVNQLMGMAVSYAIAEEDFFERTHPKVVDMLENIREAFNNLVRQTTWMDDATKCATLDKSMAMRSLVGFPKWILEDGKLDKYYNGIVLSNGTHLRNMVQLLSWQMQETLKTLRKPDEFDWATTPTNVNAFHTFQANAITVPLAILQYPFYNLGLEALNYGAIGTILGHELTHGFDDSGRMFDKNGNMRQWWSNKTVEEYVNRTVCFINQYASYYIPEADDHINGERTLGENIADNGGLREAYYGYKLYEKKFGKERTLPGFERFTHEQLLFISFGNLWCEAQTPTALKWALEDSHCPGRIRLKGVLTNSYEFSKAFNCKPESKMYPQDSCRIW